MTAPTRRSLRARRPSWAARPWGPVRWIVLLATIPSIVAFGFFALRFDALWWVGGLAALAAFAAGLRLMAAPTPLEADPYLRETGSMVTGHAVALRRLGADLLWAGLLWLVGTGAIAVVVSGTSSSDPALLAAPLFVGLVWTMGACVGALFGILVLFPLSLYLASASARRGGRRTSSGWMLGASVFLLLAVWGAASIVAAVGVTSVPKKPGEGKRTLADVLGGDVSVLAPEFQIAVWISRVSLVVTLVLVVCLGVASERARRAAGAHGDPRE